MFGIGKLSETYSSIPLWFDDIRDIGEQGIWNKIMLSAYEGTNIVKGTKERSLADAMNYNSCFIITSEFFMKSPAAVSRCLKIELNARNQNRREFNALNEMVSRLLPVIGRNVLGFAQTHRKEIARFASEMADRLIKSFTSERRAKNMAVYLTGLAMILELDVESNKDFWEELIQMVVGEQLIASSEELESKYAYTLASQIATLFSTPEFRASYEYGKDWLVKNNTICLVSGKLYLLWNKFMPRARDDISLSQQEFTKQLRGLRLAEADKGKSKKVIGGIRQSTIMFYTTEEYLHESDVTDTMVEIINMAAEEAEMNKEEDVEYI